MFPSARFQEHVALYRAGLLTLSFTLPSPLPMSIRTNTLEDVQCRSISLILAAGLGAICMIEISGISNGEKMSEICKKCFV